MFPTVHQFYSSPLTKKSIGKSLRFIEVMLLIPGSLSAPLSAAVGDILLSGWTVALSSLFQVLSRPHCPPLRETYCCRAGPWLSAPYSMLSLCPSVRPITHNGELSSGYNNRAVRCSPPADGRPANKLSVSAPAVDTCSHSDSSVSPAVRL